MTDSKQVPNSVFEIAKLTSKGQVTIPKDIRRKLGVKTGDKIVFTEEEGRLFIMNASEALKGGSAQK